MINTSAEFKEAMKENNTCISKVEILLKDGTKLSIGSNVIQGGVKIDDSVCSTGKFEIGNAISNKLCIYLNNMQDDFSEYDFTDATVTVWVGKVLSKTTEWLKKGVFCAQDPTTTPGIITLECLDNMSKFNTVYDGKLIFPATLQDIVRYCCSKCGVLLSSEAFPNSKYQVMKNPFRDGGSFTYRVIIQYCAMLAGCFARCNTDGILELKWYDTQAFETGNYAEIKSFSSLSVSTEDVVITGIRVTASDLENEDKTEKGETYLAGAEGYVLSISGNPLVGYGQAKTVASILAERIVGMRFRPMTASCLGNPSWEAGDAVLLTDRKGKIYKSFLTNLTYYTGNYESISCDAEPAARHSADHYKEIEQIIANIKRDTRSQLSQYGKYLDQMNGLAINAMGYYETVEIQDDGSRITYMHDKPLMSESMVIYKKSIDGYFWSKDGGETWTSGIDKNGNAVMNVIAAIGLQAEWITSGKLKVSDDKGNIIFLVDMDTKQVLISGDHIRIGGETATDLITTANENATEALSAAAKARNVTMQLSNDFQAIAVDSNGNYIQFPEHVETSPMVMYGTQDITRECTFQVTKSEYVQGTWDNAKKVYTVTGLTADEGWVDIKAIYMTIPVVKRFNLVKQYAGEGGARGQQGEQGETGPPGPAGTNGRNTATVYLYQRKASVPSRPTNALTYTFATGVLSGTINNGWSATIPNGTAPLYVIVATASSSASSHSIPASAWTSPVVLTQNGENGKPGANGADGKPGADGIGIKGISEKYAISSSNTVEPTTWQDTPPTMTATNRYLWNYETITFTNNTTTTTKKRVIGVYGDKGQTGGTGKPGADGADGKGIKSITNYYLAHANATGVTASTAGWNTTPQSTTTSKKYLWNYEIVTYSDGTTSQTTPCVIGTHGATGATGKPGADGTDGADGKNGLNVTTVYLYQRKTSVPPKPAAAITYTFATGAVSGLTNGWSKIIPAGTAPLYVILATASSTGATDSIAGSEWSTPTIMTENGADGAPGAPGRTYFIEPSTLVLKKGRDNVIFPGTVDFKAYYRDGRSASRTAYAGRFKIEETSDGSTWKTIYTSSANESSVKHIVYNLLTNAAGNVLVTAAGDGIGIARDIIMIRCTLYAADGTTNALDTQSVTVVTDVDNLTQEEVFDILTNSGASQGFYMEGGQIYVNASYIKSGTLVAGGANNQNGKIEIRNGSNQVIGRWDKDGIYVESGMIISKTKSGDSEVRVNGGRLNILSKNKNIGFIGTNYQENTDYRGLVFDLETDGAYMMWARRIQGNDNTYAAAFGYARKEGIMNALEESVICYRNLDLSNKEIKRAYIRNARIRGSFNIPNNTQCDIYSDIDFHNWRLKNVKFEKITGINGVLPYTGKFYATTATTPQRGATVIIRDGLITAVQEGFH